MKKAKLMLSAIAVLAVVGGAFAFKAARNVLPLYANTVVGTRTICTLPITTLLSTQNQGFGTTAAAYTSIAKPTTSCTTTQFFNAQIQ